MDIVSIDKGKTTKTVTLTNIGNAIDRELVDFALSVTNETHSSIFGYAVGHLAGYTSDEDVAMVELWTD